MVAAPAVPPPQRASGLAPSQHALEFWPLVVWDSESFLTWARSRALGSLGEPCRTRCARRAPRSADGGLARARARSRLCAAALSQEYEYEYGSDAEDFNYSDGEDGGGGGENDEMIEIENAFYEGDDCRNDDPQRALEMFTKVVTLETERGAEVKWRFKALEHLVTLQFRLGDHEAMCAAYGDMLQYISTVTRNECSEAINSILETISGLSDFKVLSRMYEITFGALKEANNERLWFNTNVKVGKVYLQNRDFARVQKIVRELHRACQTPDGQDDPAKGTSLLEVYSLEIQLCTATKNTVHMKKIYPRTLNLNAAVADPRIMGVIREEGGKM